MAKERQTFLKGALVLGVGVLLVKLIGAAFKIPLTYVLNEEGMGIFNTAYTIYAAFFVIATAGIPVAISKMVAESVSQNNHTEAKRIFNVARLLLLFIGIIGSVILFFFADVFTANIKSENSVLAIKAIAPALFFVSVLSAYRGYFQGYQNMVPTAVSEITESFCKLCIGLGLATFFARRFANSLLPAVGAVLGVTGGTMLGFVAILFIYMFTKNKRLYEKGQHSEQRPSKSSRTILRILLVMAVPITIGASVSTLTNMLDMLMVQKQLAGLGFDTLKNIVNTMGINVEYVSDIGKSIGKMATAIYGSYSGYAVTLFNFPPTMVTPISMSIVPAIAASYAVKDRQNARRIAESAIRITMIFASPCAFGLAVLAGPVLKVVFANSASAQTLSILGYAVIFVSLVSITTAMLQATGHIMLPVIHMIIGGVVKVIVNYFLVGNPHININGAPIGTNLCYLVIAVLNIIQVIRILKIRFNIADFIIKPVAASAVMAGVAYCVFAYSEKSGVFANIFIGEVRACAALAIAAGAISYILLIFIAGGIKREDIVMLPKGQRIADRLTKLHLIK